MEEGMEVGAHPQDGSFLPAHTFKGPKEGYHFTTGALGTGYYSVDRVALADKHLDEPAVGSDVAPGLSLHHVTFMRQTSCCSR